MAGSSRREGFTFNRGKIGSKRFSAAADTESTGSNNLGSGGRKSDDGISVDINRKGEPLVLEMGDGDYKRLATHISSGLVSGKAANIQSDTREVFYDNVVIFPQCFADKSRAQSYNHNTILAVNKGLVDSLHEDRNLKNVMVVPVSVTYVERLVPWRTRVVVQYGAPFVVGERFINDSSTREGGGGANEELSEEIRFRLDAAKNKSMDWNGVRLRHRMLSLSVPSGKSLTSQQVTHVSNLIESGYEKYKYLDQVVTYTENLLQYDDIMNGMNIKESLIASNFKVSRLIWMSSLQVSLLIFLIPITVMGYTTMLPALGLAKIASWVNKWNLSGSIHHQTVYAAELMLLWHASIWVIIYLLNYNKVLWIEIGIFIVPLLGYSVVASVEKELKIRGSLVAIIRLIELGHRDAIKKLRHMRKNLVDETYILFKLFNSGSNDPLPMIRYKASSYDKNKPEVTPPASPHPESDGESTPRVAPSPLENSTNTNSSFEWEYSVNPHHILFTSFPDSKEVNVLESNNWPYAHGSFYGAASMMLRDPKWTLIMEFLMPSVFNDCVKCAAASRYQLSMRIMAMLENNPVVAAYGVVTTNSNDNVEPQTDSPLMRNGNVGSAGLVHPKLGNALSIGSVYPDLPQPPWGALEWDIFLDGALMKQVG